MKYGIDSIARTSHKKVCKSVQIQEEISVTNNKNGLKINHIFWKRNVWFSILGVITVVIVFSGMGVFIIKKTVGIEESEGTIVSTKGDFLGITENNIIDAQESNIFHIVVDVEEFHIDTDIIEGKTNDDLHRGIIHQEGSSLPSKYGGNVVITGHRWYPNNGEFSKIFQNIDKLKKEDKITIEYKNKKYIYSVEKWEIVEIADTKLLEHTSESQLTIYTCHPKFTSEQRLVYTAILDSVEKID